MGSPGAGLLLLFLSLLVSPSFSTLYRASQAIEWQREFDYFVLALQWPGTSCQSTRHCCPSNGCCRRSVPLGEFTIHGLWTNYNDGSWPACCSKSHFDIKKITSLLRKLDKYWPSLSCGASSLCHGGKGPFWAHEWEKHGTCSSPVIKDEYSYFSTTLDLYFKYNITRVLNDAGFFPNNSERYCLADLISVVKKSTGASPLLICSHGAIQELHLCFYKDFKPRNCGVGLNTLDDLPISRSSCPKYVSLPEHTPFVIGNDGATVPWLPDGGVFDPVAQE